MPTIGAIKRQTISGAISTGTHGSGKPSLSHFVAAVRMAAYDPAGKPTIFEHRAGDELRAARCALGLMGVVLSVDVPTVPKYLVEDTLLRHRSLDRLLARYPEQPLTQFMLVPYAWAWMAWERHAVAMRPRTLRERFTAGFVRAVSIVAVDVFFHLMVKAALVFGNAAVKALMRLVPHILMTNVTRLDEAEHVLTLHHHLFRHEEMELFVPEQHLPAAAEVLRAAVEVFAGEAASVPAPVAARLPRDLHDELLRRRGSYVHHYPLFFRRVLRDDTLISMTADAAEPLYSISVFTYLAPDRRAAYDAFCAWLAGAMTALFDARLHWGKHFPLTVAHVARAYPALQKFKQICRAHDPDGVFRNAYVERVLGP